MARVCSVEDRKNARNTFQNLFKGFVNRYIKRPEYVSQDMRAMKRWYEENYRARFPEEAAEIDRIQAEYQQWRQSDPINNFIAKVDTGEEMPSKWNLPTLWDRFYHNFLDRYGYARPFDEAYRKMRLHAGVDGKVETFLNQGTFNLGRPAREINGKFEFAKKGKSLREVLEPVKDDLQQFKGYLVAERTLELGKRVDENGERTIKRITNEDMALAEATIQKYSNKFAKPARDLRRYMDDVLDYLVDSGIKSREDAAKMRAANQMYIPFFRVQEGAQISGIGIPETLQAADPVRFRIHGSDLPIIDPLESVIKNTVAYINMAERNMIGRALLKDAAKTPELQKMIQPVETTRETKQSLMRAISEETGLPKDVFAGLDAEQLEAFRQQAWLDEKGGTLTVWQDGKPQKYKIDRNLFESLKGLKREEIPTWLKIASQPTQWLRTGATLSPDFILRSAVRDSMEGYVYSKYGVMPGVDLVKGVFEAIGGEKGSSELYKIWKASGGAYSLKRQLGRKQLQKNLEDLTRNQHSLKNILFKDIGGLEMAGRIAESATRLREFNLGLMKEGLSGIEKAALASRDVTLDFQRRGAMMGSINQLIAFANARVQGHLKFWESMVPKLKDGKFDTQDLYKTSLKAVTSMTMPALILAAYNQGQKWYQELPEYQKQLFYVFKLPGDETIYRIPKPPELGTYFSNLPEALASFIHKKDPEALTRWLDGVTAVGASDFTPTTIKPFLEDWANKSMLTGQKLVPYGKEALLPRMQYTPYGTEVGRKVGGFIADLFGEDTRVASPARLENYFAGWTGSLGKGLLRYLDLGLQKSGVIPDSIAPASRVQELPFFSAFSVSHPESNTHSLRRYYEMVGEAKSFQQSIKKLLEEGDNKTAAKLIAERKDIMSKPGHKRIQQMSQTAKKIKEHPDITPEDKRKLIDQIYLQMTDLATVLVDEMKQTRKK